MYEQRANEMMQQIDERAARLRNAVTALQIALEEADEDSGAEKNITLYNLQHEMTRQAILLLSPVASQVFCSGGDAAREAFLRDVMKDVVYMSSSLVEAMNTLLEK